MAGGNERTEGWDGMGCEVKLNGSREETKRKIR